MTEQQVINIFNELRGVPFKQHGRDTKGLDCFGVFLFFAKKIGLKIPDYDYAPEWEKHGEDIFLRDYHLYADEIEKQYAKAGDIVLIKNDTVIVNHIGIMLNKYKFMHCELSGVVSSTVSKYERRIAGFFRLRK